MSQADLEKFRQQEILNNAELQARIKAASSAEEIASLSVKVGQEKGYSFTVDEVLASIKEAVELNGWQPSVTEQDLSDEQLEAVAGGRSQQLALTDNWAILCGT